MQLLPARDPPARVVNMEKERCFRIVKDDEMNDSNSTSPLAWK